MWELLDVAGKEEARAAMKAVVVATAKEGVKQSKKTVTERAADMGLGENGYQIYRQGAVCLFSLFEAIHTVALRRVAVCNRHTLTHCTQSESSHHKYEVRVTSPQVCSTLTESAAGGGPAYHELWPHLDKSARIEARRDMKESAADVTRKGGAAGGAVTGRVKRKNFDKEVMDAVRDRDLAWADAKRVLGHGHEIFSYPPGSTGTRRPRSAHDAPAKEIKKLADTLSLIRWREEPASVHLLRFTDAEVKEIVHSLRNLVDKLRTWGEKRRETKGK
jgi:hypothetical protein